jgi:hypothetical protein
MIGSCCCGGVSSSTTRKRNDSALLATRRTDSRNHFVIAGRARSVRVGVFKIMIAANEQARELRSHGGVQINRILARLDVPKLASDLNRVRNSNDLSHTIIIRPKLWSSVRRSAQRTRNQPEPVVPRRRNRRGRQYEVNTLTALAFLSSRKPPAPQGKQAAARKRIASRR